jgi:hypothetical protein
VPLRAAGRDDEPVGDGALSLEVDEDDVLGLVVVQPVEDQVLETAYGARGSTGGFGVGRGLMRRSRRFTVQRGDSFYVLA